MNYSFGLLFALLGALDVGQVAPDFTVEDSVGNTQSLRALRDTGPVVLVFFPKAFTGGCTQELTALTQAFARLQKKGAHVLAVSGDSAETLQKFAASLKAPFHFIADTKGDLMRRYDVKMPLLSVAKRTTFLIARDGHIVRVDKGKGALSIDPLTGALETLSN